MEIAYDRLDNLINEISLGGKIVPLIKASGDEVFLFVSHCVGIDRLYADLEYKKSYDRAIKDGFLTVEQTSELLRSRGLLEDDSILAAKIKSIESKIAGQEAILEKLVRVPSRKDRVKENIETLKNELLQVLSKKEEYLEFSAERKAQEDKFLYLTWRSVKEPFSMKLFWPTKEDFNKDTDLILRRSAFSEYIKVYSGIDVSIVRHIARSNLWRIKYITSLKTGISLFGRELTEYTVDQLSLAYWSHFYQSIYDMPSSDAPAESIIEDDAALDAFMKSYMADRNRENTQAREKKKIPGNKSAWDYNETIVMKSNPAFKDIEFSPVREANNNKEDNVLNVKK